MWTRMNLTSRMVTLVILGLLVVFAAFGSVSMWTLGQSTKRSLQERLLLAEVAAKSIDNYNRGILKQLQDAVASNSATLRDSNAESERLALNDIRSRLSAHEVFRINEEGNVVAIQPPKEDAIGAGLAANRYVGSAFFGRQPQVSAIVPSLVDGKSVIVYLTPLFDYDGQTVAGAVGASFDLERSQISGFIEAIHLGRTGYAQVVDEKGELLASTVPANVSEKSDHGDRFVALIQDRKTVVRTCHSCHEPEGSTPRRKDVMAFAPLSTASWGVAVRQSEEEALGPTRRLKWGMLGIGIPSSLLGLALTAVFMRRTLRPVRLLTEGAQKIAAGDLSGPIEARGEDEIAILGKTFESMRVKLEASRREIEERARGIERRNTELSALNAIASTLSQSFELKISLGAALDNVLSVMGSTAGAMFLADAEGQPMKVEALRNLSNDSIGLVAQWRRESPDGEVAPRLHPLPETVGQGAGSAITVPLLSKGRTHGLLLIVIAPDRTVEPRELEFLGSVGHQVGVAIDNASLFREQQERKQEAEALFQLGVEISDLLDVDRILNSVVAQARELLHADVATLSLLDEASSSIYVRAASGARTEALTGLVLHSGQGFTGRVISDGRPASTEEYLADPGLWHSPEADSIIEKEELISHLGAPLKIGAKVIGALTVAHRERHRFQSQEADLLSRLANQAAIAIENARLYGEVQRKDEQRGQLLERVISIQEEERGRIARELHDDSAQTLSALIMQLESIAKDLPPEFEAARQQLNRHRLLVVRALEDIRRVIADIRPMALDDLGLMPSIRWHAANRLEEKGVQVTVESTGLNFRLPLRLETALFRVAQEAINNIAKHAECSTANVSLEVNNSSARLIIEDNGKGFDVTEVMSPRARRTGLGLLGMRERVALFKGTLDIVSTPEGGTRVIVEVPLERDERNGNG